MEISRRDLLKTTANSGLIAAGLAASEGLFKPLLSQAETDELVLAQSTPAATKQGEMLYRTLGRTGQRVSAIGLGGFHIGKIKEEQESIKLIRTAISTNRLGLTRSIDIQCESKTIELSSRSLKRHPVIEYQRWRNMHQRSIAGHL